MQAFLKRHWPVLLLTLIGLIAYGRWLNFSTFLSGDWTYRTAAALKAQLWPSVWLGYTHFGEADLVVWRYPAYVLYGIMAYLLGAGSSVSEKLIVFWPIAFLLPVAGYALVKRATGSRVGGFVGGLVAAYNTYYLAIDTQGHELITAAVAPGIFALLLYEEALEKASMPRAIGAALCLFVCGFLDFRVAYLFAAVMALAWLYDVAVTRGWRRSLRVWTIAAAPYLAFAVLNVFWLAPQLAMHALTENRVLDRGLFGDQFWSLKASLTLFHPFWTGGGTAWFVAQPVPPLFWCIPLAAFLGLYLCRKDPRIVFYGLVALIGIFLAKQGEAPFAEAYPWMFDHVPGFSAFREATKFYILTALGYAVMIGALAERIRAWRPAGPVRRFVRLAALPALCAIFLSNAMPMIDGRIGSLFTPTTRPDAYAALERRLAADPDFFRTVNLFSGSAWQPFSDAHPKLTGQDLNLLVKSVDMALSDAGAPTPIPGLDFFRLPQAGRALELAAVRYVFVAPADKRSSNFSDAEDRKTVVDLLDSRPFLKKLTTGDDGSATYETTDRRPHLYLAGQEESLDEETSYAPVVFARASATRYDIVLEPSEAPAFLEFSERYHPDWRLYEGRVSWFDVLLDRKGLPVEGHVMNVVGLNAYRLDPSADGRRLTLYFRPQAYLYLGLIVSGTALAACLAYLIRSRVRARKRLKV